jgi:FlaA1/EpsC-like NDP-sugar epimerase
MTRFLITGAGTPIGQTLIKRLLENPTTDKIIAVHALSETIDPTPVDSKI